MSVRGMIDLNVLKIAGALVAGLAGIIGILGQTRTADNKLTRSGKWLFGMAIVGVVLAMSTQIWEWRKAIEDDRIAQRKNQELLLKLDTEAQLAAKSLHEVKRTLTRFQTISFDWYYTFDTTDQLFGPYIQELMNRVEVATSNGSFKEGDQGLHRRISDTKSGKISAFSIDADSIAMPDVTKYALLRNYLLEVVPEIRVFKTPIPPENFVQMPPGAYTSRHNLEPDLVLKLNPGKLVIVFYLPGLEFKIPTIRVEHSNMDASLAFTSGDIVSSEDLAGCQAIVSLPPLRRELRQPWSTASRHMLRCRVNDQIVAVCSDFTLPSRLHMSRLLSAQTRDPRIQPMQDPRLGELIYSFTFPTTTSAGGK
jgi:hypothetical protein